VLCVGASSVKDAELIAVRPAMTYISVYSFGHRLNMKQSRGLTIAAKFVVLAKGGLAQYIGIGTKRLGCLFTI
jgi:hypothetical protein